VYQIQLSEAALHDLEDFLPGDIETIYGFLKSLAENPIPAGTQSIPLAEAANGTAYLHENNLCSIFYNIFETARIVRVVAIFKKVYLN
jgi:hypothetical protein